MRVERTKKELAALKEHAANLYLALYEERLGKPPTRQAKYARKKNAQDRAEHLVNHCLKAEANG